MFTYENRAVYLGWRYHCVAAVVSRVNSEYISIYEPSENYPLRLPAITFLQTFHHRLESHHHHHIYCPVNLTLTDAEIVL